MNDFILSCCSTADLTKELFEQRKIQYICYHYALDGKEYLDDLGQSMDFHDFYKAMTDGADTRTSQINVEEYKKYFVPFLESGKDILHVTLSSGISGSCNSAMIAADDLREQYPDRKIYIIDSLNASGGYGLFVDKLADLRDEGKSAEEIVSWANEHKLKCHAWFFSTDLTFYVKGGRVSKTSGFVGSVLDICPLLNINVEGKLIPRSKIRTKKRVISACVRKMEEHAQGGYAYSDKCFVTHSDCYEDARAVADMIEEKFPKLNGKVEISYVGTTIGSHTGPGTVALFFWGDKREE